MHTQTKEYQATLTPTSALEILRKGNARFQEDISLNRNLLTQATITADGQFPFAVILGCIDSRASAELVFDQGFGDIFSVRIAGNVLSEDVLGSMEFACKLAGSMLIVVMGHSSCGAVRGAATGAELGNLTGLLNKIKPAVEDVAKTGIPEGPEQLQKIAEANVANVVRELRSKSSVLDEMISEGTVGIVGAMHNVRSGAVEFQTLEVGPA